MKNYCIFLYQLYHLPFFFRNIPASSSLERISLYLDRTPSFLSKFSSEIILFQKNWWLVFLKSLLEFQYHTSVERLLSKKSLKSLVVFFLQYFLHPTHSYTNFILETETFNVYKLYKNLFPWRSFMSAFLWSCKCIVWLTSHPFLSI